ncbi:MULTISPECIES: helix-turn-helix transcriptional regulator [Streptococcus]|uniref:XRE family transcriptional regulator n=1 Tax=Streptococcus dysgalactiae subsp. dysgalactiae TaxID=99822 RepID=A0A9X7S5F8_STRDY|nr:MULTISPECIES: helix-turn-helix transcriptional regulator [Streptococcus]PIO77945.1 transcriptional repressor DicA [Streptococcus parauberis]POS66618.1 transcriptional repressor DicA [Streptococcus parauberis]QGH01265.1 XRE family transcriptional regulator [Streptococcus dysgalactiae subsp. dysgalactiae]
MIENFAPNLIRLRKQKGLSQKELAQELGISSQTISNIENQSAYPTFTNLEKIAGFFNASPTDLFGTPQQIQLEKAVFETDEYSDKASTILKASKAISELEDDSSFQELINNLLFLTRGYQLYDAKGDELYRDNDGKLTSDEEFAVEMATGNSRLEKILNSEDKINDLFEKITYIENLNTNKD